MIRPREWLRVAFPYGSLSVGSVGAGIRLQVSLGLNYAPCVGGCVGRLPEAIRAMSRGVMLLRAGWALAACLGWFPDARAACVDHRIRDFRLIVLPSTINVPYPRW